MPRTSVAWVRLQRVPPEMRIFTPGRRFFSSSNVASPRRPPARPPPTRLPPPPPQRHPNPCQACASERYERIRWGMSERNPQSCDPAIIPIRQSQGVRSTHHVVCRNRESAGHFATDRPRKVRPGVHVARPGTAIAKLCQRGKTAAADQITTGGGCAPQRADTAIFLRAENSWRHSSARTCSGGRGSALTLCYRLPSRWQLQGCSQPRRACTPRRCRRIAMSLGATPRRN